MRWTLGIATALSGLLLTGALIAAAFPGPHRMLCPGCFGLVEIAPDVFTDAPPARHAGLLRMIAAADRTTSRFFGGLQSRPWIVMCATKACMRAFTRGHHASGVTFGWHVIRLAPRGLRQHIMTHERMHAELHRRLGYAGMAQNAIPTWFDEGLAVLISNDRRLISRQSRAATQWISSVHSPSDWRRAVSARGWRATYSAAVTRVVAYERVIGRAGLRRVVARVVAGQDFEAALHGEVTAAKRARPRRRRP
ncbi:MAG: hypothetical protein AAF732_10375 [Pseudomonadota bacterium]